MLTPRQPQFFVVALGSLKHVWTRQVRTLITKERADAKRIFALGVQQLLPIWTSPRAVLQLRLKVREAYTLLWRIHQVQRSLIALLQTRPKGNIE